MTTNKTQGPINPNHKKYISNDKSIINVLCVMIKSRRINIRAVELYKPANLSSPTFYLHYRSADDVRQHYEQDLKMGLKQRVPRRASPQIFFTILVNFILHNQQYFIAVSESCDHYLLTEILVSHRRILVSRGTSTRAFMAYIGHLQVVIDCWLKFDLPKEASIEKCVKELIKIKPPRSDQKSDKTGSGSRAKTHRSRGRKNQKHNNDRK